MVRSREEEGLAALRGEVEELRAGHLPLQDADLFVLWFVRAYLDDDLAKATAAVVGAANDKGVDAVYIDDGLRKAFVVQGKYRLAGGGEKTSDIRSFANLAPDLLGGSDQFATLCAGIDPLVKERLETVRDRTLKRKYHLELIYVTLGSISEKLRKEAAGRASAVGASFTPLARKETLRLLENYLDGVAPPIPEIEIEINGKGTLSRGEVKRIDTRFGVDSWVFSVGGDELARLFNSTGRRLFARNIRGYLGDHTPVNDAMARTLATEPEEFWYFNNGVTMICDEATRVDKGNKQLLRISNPQIINGQQTTRTIAEHHNAKKASVLLRVMALPQSRMSLVTETVRAANSQNRIRQSDLMSNDRVQVIIERSLRKLGYSYLRKRQTKSEAKRQTGIQAARIISKDDVAQAVAACELSPEIVRSAKERLFDDDYYGKVFASDDPFYYLSRYWLLRFVELSVRGDTEASYAKFFAMHIIWRTIGADVSQRPQTFVRYAEHTQDFADLDLALDRVIDHAVRGVMQFFRSNRGTGSARYTVYSFFKRQGRVSEFDQFLKGRSVKKHLDAAAKQFRSELGKISK